MTTDLAAIFGKSGRLAARLPNFQHREQQQAMAERIAAVMRTGGVLICEAGTGTGKTFAYLVPALLSRRKVLISTGTRNLQDQLFHRDLPLMRTALGIPVSSALLKGRANYLCRHRLALLQEEVVHLTPELQQQLALVRDWAQTTQAGDIAELPLPEDAPIWAEITSTVDNCLGQECAEFQRCHLVTARREAQAAEVVVVNHHLLCADLALRDEGLGELLPGADCFVIDEAHQLPDTASSFFGISFSSRQLHDLATDTEIAAYSEAQGVVELPRRVKMVQRATAEVRISLGGETDRRAPWRDLADNAEVQRTLAELEQKLQALALALKALQGHGKNLDACQARAATLLARLHTLLAPEPPEAVRWFETNGRGFRLHQTPLSVADVFRKHVGQAGTAWIFTSATLAVGERFEHFAQQLGIENAQTARWESPFDYAKQALWFVPRGLPQPSAPEYNQHVIALAREVIGYSRGRAFLLFTSYRALHETAAGLNGQLDYPLLIQGTAPRAELLARFRELGNAVLLGTASFWEGVDVRGEALSCVLIDRLPFASPGDPVLAARIDALRQRGGNPFQDYQLPQAVIALKQGAGRLIRDQHDRGVLVVCDPRLLAKSYGHTFLASLPPMARTRVIEDVKTFFDAAECNATVEVVKTPIKKKRQRKVKS
ncbi:helicase [Chromatium okenii]|uniref:ATP-dependent DNA helicase n=1 Tax=Chromatium okenii TaxID=61644 RepID=UPI00190407C1|nr:ATP-dependent DNA helicase [Chromatium okenii]MBK1640732.1 helicase [Chromatium okenii]